MNEKMLSNKRELRAQATLKNLDVNNSTYLVLFPFLVLEGFTLLSLTKTFCTKLKKDPKRTSRSRICLSEEDTGVRIVVISDSGTEEMILAATYTCGEKNTTEVIDVDFVHKKINNLPISTQFSISVTKKTKETSVPVNTNLLNLVWFGRSTST